MAQILKFLANFWPSRRALCVRKHLDAIKMNKTIIIRNYRVTYASSLAFYFIVSALSPTYSFTFSAFSSMYYFASFAFYPTYYFQKKSLYWCLLNRESKESKWISFFFFIFLNYFKIFKDIFIWIKNKSNSLYKYLYELFDI